ncbi:MAG: hypothetical protein WKF30_13675 [Pyrinomonadaceae bacterium]
MTPPPPKVDRFKWPDLELSVRLALEFKLENLYSCASGEAAFEALQLDKQQALLFFHARLQSHGLWQHVLRVENVYGHGGVGMSFTAGPSLFPSLTRHRSFRSRLFASAARPAISFRETCRRRAALHFIGRRTNRAREHARDWSVHFDHYNPLHSPANAWRHIFFEHLRRRTPDWQAIDKALREG